MVDSASGSKLSSDMSLYDFSVESNNQVVEKFIQNLHQTGDLSDAEIKFLSKSKEKKLSLQLLDNIISSKLTLYNYKEIFCLQEFSQIGGTINPDQAVRNIRFKDSDGIIVATVQIDTLAKKIRVQNLGNIFPKIESYTPYQVGTKLQSMAQFNKWSTEDGGVNCFNGNEEIRYKDKSGNVMAAIITKDNGVYDTVAEYEYKSGHRSKMVVTNSYGNSIVIYDGSENVNQIVRIDIDNDGMIIEITKIYTD